MARQCSGLAYVLLDASADSLQYVFGAPRRLVDLPSPQTDPTSVDALLASVPRPDKELAAILRRQQRSALPEAAPSADGTLWAVTQPTDVSNFRQLVPEMALEYPFELDSFQKQAIYHLERSECVFVAAHTSAGAAPR